MSTIPRANFEDPLLAERSRRRMELFRTRMLTPWVVALLLIGAIAGGVALHPAVAPVVVVLAMAITWYFADSKARAEWWVLLVHHLGMELDVCTIDGLTPLLRSGDEREVLRAASDGRRRLLVFRSTDVSRDSKGNESKTHHDYTCVQLKDAAPAIRFLSAHEHRVGWAKWLGDDLRGRTIGGVDEFKVESVDLHEKFELRSSTVDGERARMIFSPSFILWFTRQGVAFEYEGGDLLVIVDRVLEHAEEYKVLLARADEIHTAIARVGPTS
ncbi:MAG: hypothetical protein J7513_05095 [Solirubrobacteraceae bacterium]|nr:hypothetical protein [Solirubrobacteraceae bacterium]